MGVGYVLADPESARVLVRVGSPIGHGTNNEAEYQALLAGMRHALKLGFWNLEVKADSLLVVNQVSGRWRSTNKTLARLAREVENLRRLFTSFTIEHVRREGNSEADALSRQIVFEEPELPPLPLAPNRKPKALHDWQAAAIRYWTYHFSPGNGTLGRIFGLTGAQVDQIADHTAYRSATFDTFTPHLQSIGLHNPS